MDILHAEVNKEQLYLALKKKKDRNLPKPPRGSPLLQYVYTYI